MELHDQECETGSATLSQTPPGFILSRDQSDSEAKGRLGRG